jgi:hypothetical protein
MASIAPEKPTLSTNPVFLLPKTSILEPTDDVPHINQLATPEDISGIQTARQELWTTGQFSIQGIKLDMNILLRSKGKASPSNGLYGTDDLKKIARALEVSNPTSMKKEALIAAIVAKIRTMVGSGN